MTQEQFGEFFYAVYNGIPNYAKASIEAYLHGGVISEIIASDDAADKAQEDSGAQVPAAGLVVFQDKWYFVFRPFLFNAPEVHLRAIVQHEMVHGFVISEDMAPTDQGQEALMEYKHQVSNIVIVGGIEIPEGYDITEDLICFINDEWGADDKGAKEWLQQHLQG